ncbi:hypothetical protein PYW08_008372 [Mythimna loreyi]|uniref:Uncharacterized protein n=1 Tax=Mythimna loreyi TaxID=667449 RepID=A0ACC2QDX2_9NEOP|nr:hypothetical protein PYW08_008372 [Mythimna loreyi]
MLNLFLYFALVSSVVSQTTENKKVALKDQLVRSISHVNEMLVDIEGKIGREREILSQIDHNLSESKEVDVDYGINIFWNGTSTKPGVSGKFGNYTYTIRTTPSLFPTPTTKSTYATIAVNWHLSTIVDGVATTDSLYIEDLKKNMAAKQYGYFTAFVDEFSELMFSKPVSDAYTVSTYLSLLLKKSIREGKFNSMSDELVNGMGTLLVWYDTLTPARVQQQAGVLHHIIQVKDKSMSEDMNNLINFYDSLCTKEDGQKLFESLELFFVYPEANVTLATVGDKIFQAALAPYFKTEGTRKHKRLIQLLFMAVHDLDPHFRRQNEANEFAKDGNQTYMANRRMNYKRFAKHLLFKHRKLFKKLKRQYKHDKKKKHHRISHKQKHHYRASINKHHKRRRRQDHKRIKQKSHTESNEKLQNDEIEKNSNKYNPYYDEQFKTHQQENIQNSQSTETREKPERKQIKVQPEPRQRKLYKRARTSTSSQSILQYPDHDQDYPQHLKQSTNDLLKNKQQNEKSTQSILQYPDNDQDYPQHLKQSTNDVSKNKQQNEKFKQSILQYPDNNDQDYPQHLKQSTNDFLKNKQQNEKFKQSILQYPDNDQDYPQHLKQSTNNVLKNKQENEKFKQSILQYPDNGQLYPQHLKQSTNDFLSNGQQNENRRFNSLSGEDNHSQNTIKNKKLNKVREASSYSDEENHLKMNLYDALRHGNKTFVSFRRSNGDTVTKQPLRDLSSEPDEEWVLKKNIYKFFE